MKKIILILFFIFTLLPCYINALDKKVYDNADLFSSHEEDIINSKINKYIYNYNIDFVVLTTLINTSKNTDKYVKDFYNENNFGIGNYKSGIIFIIDKDNNKNSYYVFGEAQKYIDKKRDNDINNYINKMYNSTNKNYYALITSFIDKIDSYTKEGIPKSNQKKYIDTDGILKSKHSYSIFISLFTSLVISILFTSIVVYLLTRKKDKYKVNYNSIINYSVKDDVLINSEKTIE